MDGASKDSHGRIRSLSLSQFFDCLYSLGYRGGDWNGRILEYLAGRFVDLSKCKDDYLLRDTRKNQFIAPHVLR